MRKPLKFDGRTMAEALAKVKKALGPDAVIVGTRVLQRGGAFGGGARVSVEITAQHDEALATIPSAREWKAAGVVQDRTTVPVDATMALKVGKLTDQVAGLESMVRELVNRNREESSQLVPEELLDHYQRLIQAEVASDVARQWVEALRGRFSAHQLKDTAQVQKELIRFVIDRIPAGMPIQLSPSTKPTIIALVGPAGVGKTTTLSKLAADLALREKRKVGLISLDFFRLGAVHQLDTYARILNVPLFAARSADQYADALHHLRDCEAILVDTPGCGKNDVARFAGISNCLERTRPHEIHLTLSCATPLRVLEDSMKRFEPMGFNRLLFTKLDEALGFGTLLNCLERVSARLSYVTHGQNVPGDIAVGEKKLIARLVLQGPAGLPPVREAHMSDQGTGGTSTALSA